MGRDARSLSCLRAREHVRRPVLPVLLARVGLLAFAVAWSVDRVLELAPLTANLGAWHAGPTIAGLLALLALVAAGTRAALAGRPLLGGQLRGE